MFGAKLLWNFWLGEGFSGVGVYRQNWSRFTISGRYYGVLGGGGHFNTIIFLVERRFCTRELDLSGLSWSSSMKDGLPSLPFGPSLVYMGVDMHKRVAWPRPVWTVQTLIVDQAKPRLKMKEARTGRANQPKLMFVAA